MAMAMATTATLLCQPQPSPLPPSLASSKCLHSGFPILHASSTTIRSTGNAQVLILSRLSPSSSQSSLPSYNSFFPNFCFLSANWRACSIRICGLNFLVPECSCCCDFILRLRWCDAHWRRTEHNELANTELALIVGFKLLNITVERA
jgi:hypothetical protein